VKEPGSESSRERNVQGAKGPGSELAMVLLADSLQGAKRLGIPNAKPNPNPNRSHPTNPNCTSNTTKLTSFRRPDPQKYPDNAILANALHNELLVQPVLGLTDFHNV